jgi:hypothetical protein
MALKMPLWQGNDCHEFPWPSGYFEGLDPLIAQEKYTPLAQQIVPHHQSKVLD